MSFAGRERAALLDLLTELGPTAPTLCAGWTTHDLAAHLVARERAPLALPGLVVAPLHGLTEVFERRAARSSWSSLLDALRRGAPVWSPVALPATNVHELFVHHEDVRRLVSPDPRVLSRADQDELWRRLRVLGPLLVRRARGLGVRLVTPGARDLVVRRGRDEVVLRGEVGELFLWLFGRDVAQVELDGSADAVARMAAAERRW